MPSEKRGDGPGPRILIVRLSSIGDVIHSVPVLCALRRQWPGAFLAWVVEAKAAALLEGHSALDHLVAIPRAWWTSVRTIGQIRGTLRALRVDTAIDVQGLTKSGLVAWLSGAKRRVGFARPVGREIAPWFYTLRVRTTGPHVIDHNLQLLRPLGIEAPEVRFDLPENPKDRAAADAILGQLGLQGGYAILNPGAGWVSRRWPLERYAAVARHLASRWRLPSLVVWAGAQERAWAERIVHDAAPCAGLAPPTSLCTLASLARRARLFIGSDTGPLHLAAAVGTPCVALHGPTRAERTGPYGPSHVALQERVFQGPRRKRRDAPPALMEAISVEKVCGACDSLLGRHMAPCGGADPTAPQ